MCYHAFQRGQSQLRQVLARLADLYEDNLFLANFTDFVELRPRVVEPARPRPVPQPIRHGIVFENVSFQYPTGTAQVLRGVSLAIRPGEHVALVGENGAGKTTLVKLLCRLYDPSAGRITIDGIDLRHFSTCQLRRHIAAVFQDYTKYHLTARENIWLGDVDLPPRDERILAAARQAGADPAIARLPNGYETTLGKRFEDGEELSIGEWQKVALARAFVRDAQIIILDEPTSAMDAGAEHELFRRFRQLARGRSAVLISHRFSTVRMADRICVLHDGRIIEKGTHDELVARNGTYERLFETQAQFYR